MNHRGRRLDSISFSTVWKLAPSLQMFSCPHDLLKDCLGVGLLAVGVSLFLFLKNGFILHLFICKKNQQVRKGMVCIQESVSPELVSID